MGTLLLLAIALAALSLVYMYVLSYPLPDSAPYVEIVGSLEDGNIVLLHCGGENLDLDTELLVNISNTTYVTTVGNYLDSKSKENGAWDIGERVVYTPTVDITNLYVEAAVIDRETNSMLMTGILQEG
ncbi:MAG: hypothetical protein KAV40_05295 [Thermoplasmatales archaeon]|nr:hypothetical protein [Thermoplasmatales archaeon]